MPYSLPVKCAVAMFVAGCCSHAGASSDRIGIYHWGGERTRSMADGIDRIASLGGTVARVAFSPRYYSDYGMRSGCYPEFSLTKLAHEPDVERALDNQRIRVLILTAYDGVTFGDCYTHKYLNPRFYTAENIASLKAEYSEFVLHLFRRYNGSGRRFILSNWEGDNAIYCGEAYRYAVSASFRQTCDFNYPGYYDGNAGPEQSLEGMRLWLQVRQDGIRQGVQMATSVGLSEVEVLHAPEISAVRMLEERGIPGVLQDVLGPIRPDYVSYSAYESLNSEDPVAALAGDVELIRYTTGVTEIIIGEAGYSRTVWGAAAVERLEAVLQESLASGAAYFICWNLNDQGGSADFGMFDSSDHLTPVGAWIEELLRPERRSALRSAAARSAPLRPDLY